MNGTGYLSTETVESPPRGLSSQVLSQAAPRLALLPNLNRPSKNANTMQPQMSTQPVDRLAFGDDSVLMDPELIKAARYIYRTFYEVHPEVMQRPIGVAIGRRNRRGKLVFGDKPVLLPQECFVPFSQIEPALI